jgi:hypothetical protein
LDVITILLDGGITDPDKEYTQLKDFNYRPLDLLDDGMHQNDHGQYHIRYVARVLGSTIAASLPIIINNNQLSVYICLFFFYFFGSG